MNNMKLMLGPSVFLLLVIFSVISAAVGAPAMLMYLLLVKLLYAFIVSMVVENWRKKDVALVETSETRWSVNINGIPVNDVSNALFNLHFKNERDLRSAFLKLLFPKVVVTVALMFMAFINIVEAYQPGAISPFIVFHVIVACYVTFKMTKLLGLLVGINASKWYLHNLDFGTHTYYSAYTKQDNSLEPYLVKVFD